MSRSTRKRALLATALALAAAILAPAALAGWSSAVTAGPMPVSSATLAAPTGLGASCANSKATLTWTQTSSIWADGYDVGRSLTNGGPYTVIKHIVGRGIVTYADATVNGLSIYYYIVRASKSTNWRSGNSNQVTVDSSNC
jgi:hypothetical protein